MSEPIVILDQWRGPGEVLRVCISEFKGRQYVDCRVWFTGQGGEFRPGKAGITLREESLPAVLEALEQAYRRLVADVEQD